MKKNYISKAFVGSCAIAAVMAMASCNGKNDKAVTQAQEDETPIVEVLQVNMVEVPLSGNYTATVEADNINNISPASPNRIKSIRVDVGDQVRRGQVLVTLDASQLDQLKINLEQIKREYDRASQLLEIGSGTRQQVDQLKAQYDAARSQYNNMRENTVLTSPISGVVTARNYDPGDMTGSLPVLTVGQLSPRVKMILNPSETDVTSFTRGQDVEVALDAFPDEKFTAKVSRISPTVDPATRTFQVELLLPNPGSKILPGMFGRVISGKGSRNSVVVPDRAVVKQPGSANRYVYVYKNGTVSYNKVELGERLDENYELLSGVESGDSVVIAGQSRLSHGAKARLKNK